MLVDTICLLEKISVHTADVKAELKVFSLEVPAGKKEELNEDPIIIKLRKVRTCVDHRI